MKINVICEKDTSPSVEVEQSVSHIPDGHDIQGLILNNVLEAYELFKSQFGRPSVIIVEIDEDEDEEKL